METMIHDEQTIIQMHQKINDLSRELLIQKHHLQTPKGRSLLKTSAKVMEILDQAFERFLSESERKATQEH